MELAALIQSRRTVQVFNDKPVDESLVHQALELALWAPNHKLTYPWRFVLVGPQARAELAELSVTLKEKKKGSMSAIEKEAAKKSFLQPSHLVVVGMTKNPDLEVRREDYAAVAAGLQNTQLFLWQKDVGSKWGTGSITRHPTVYRLAELDPQAFEVVGFLWVGHFDRVPAVPPRPPSQEIIRKVL